LPELKDGFKYDNVDDIAGGITGPNGGKYRHAGKDANGNQVYLD